MATSEERARMNPISAALDMIGLPKPDDVIPVPADVAGDLGVPTPDDLVKKVKESVRSKVRSRRL